MRVLLPLLLSLLQGPGSTTTPTAASLKTGDDSCKEWRQFQGGAARQGRLCNMVAGPSENITRPSQIIKLGNGSQSMAVVGLNGTLFIPTENHLGEIKAFAADGQEIWSYQVWPELHPDGS